MDRRRKKAVPGQIFPKNPALTNTGKNDEYVFLEVSMPLEEVQMLYEQEITFTKTDTEISDVSDYTKTSYESGTKKGSESLQEIFRTIADTNGEKISIDNQTFDFSYHAGNATTEGWIFLEVSDTTERDFTSSEEKHYRKYLFGYNQKLEGDISNTSETPSSTIALFDKIQLKSFIDEKILGAEKDDMNEEKNRYESKLEEIKINAYGIQADNLSLTLGEFLTQAQLNQIYDIAKQKMG